jgi:hypothetical protein
MCATNNHPELITQLSDGISRFTTSDEWQRYLDCQSRFHTTVSATYFSSLHSATRPPGSQASTPGGSSDASSAKGRRPYGFWPSWSTRTPTQRTAMTTR